MKATLPLAAGLFLSACTTAAQTGVPHMTYDILQRPQSVTLVNGPGMEPLYAVAATRDGLRLRVASNGCTSKADFKMMPLPDPQSGSMPNKVLILFRLKPDKCQSFAMGSTWIEFSYAEIDTEASDKIQLSNPLTAWTGPGE